MNPVIQALRELGQYLGAKIDTLAASKGTISVDMSDTSKSIGDSAKALSVAAKNIASAAEKISSYDKMTGMLSSDLSTMNKGLKDAVMSIKEVSSVIDKTSKNSGLNFDFMQEQMKQLSAAMDKIAANVNAIKPTDMSETIKALKDVNKAVSGIKLVLPSNQVAKLDDISASIGGLRDAMISRAQYVDRTDEVIAAIRSIKIQVPESMKLDASQLGAIRYGGGGGGATASHARTAVTANVAMTTANTQYSYTFPSNTIGFRIKLRDQGTLMYYSWQSGTLPGSGTGTAYATVQQNGDIVRDNLDVGNKTIYFESDTNSMVAEIESFTLQ